MGKTYKESYYGSKQAKLAAEYQSKKKIKHSKMTAYNRKDSKQFMYETIQKRKATS